MKNIILLGLLSITVLFATAQKTRLNAFTAYVFDDAFDSYYDNNNYYSGTVNGGFQWGVGVEHFLKPQYSLELLYLHQGTKAPTYYQKGIGSSVEFDDFDLNINYILAGGLRHIQKPDSKVEGLAGFLVGVALLDVESSTNNGSGSATKFAWGMRLGCNIWASEKFGIKVQTQLLSVTQGAGGGLYFGTGGVGAGVSSYSSIYQFVLGGGLVVALGK